MTNQDHPQVQPHASSEGPATVELTPEQKAARGRRNLAIGLGLASFVALLFIVSLERLGGDAANTWNYQAPTESSR